MNFPSAPVEQRAYCARSNANFERNCRRWRAIRANGPVVEEEWQWGIYCREPARAEDRVFVGEVVAALEERFGAVIAADWIESCDGNNHRGHSHGDPLTNTQKWRLQVGRRFLRERFPEWRSQ